MNIYQAGCVTAINGSNIVEGFGTRWLNYAKPSDRFTLGGATYDIQSVNDNHQLTLTVPFSGPSVERCGYEIEVAPLIKTLMQIQAEACSAIDALTGQTRLKYMTITLGQGTTYAKKLADAKAYIADGYPPDATPYIWVNSESVETGATPAVVADSIVYAAELSDYALAQIDGKRVAAKQAINSPTATELGVYAIEQDFKTAMALL